MFPFSHGILEFQAMVAAGMTPLRARESRDECGGEPVAAGRYRCACTWQTGRIVALAGDPIADIAVTERVDFSLKPGESTGIRLLMFSSRDREAELESVSVGAHNYRKVIDTGVAGQCVTAFIVGAEQHVLAPNA